MSDKKNKRISKIDVRVVGEFENEIESVKDINIDMKSENLDIVEKNEKKKLWKSIKDNFWGLTLKMKIAVVIALCVFAQAMGTAVVNRDISTAMDAWEPLIEHIKVLLPQDLVNEIQEVSATTTNIIIDQDVENKI